MEEVAQEPTAEETPAEETPAVATAAGPVPDDGAETRAEEKPEDDTTAPEAAAVSKVSTAEEAQTTDATTVFAAGPAAPTAAPVRLVTTQPSETFEDHDAVHVPQRDAAAHGVISDMHIVRPITSPRADSKLKTWFRDRLTRRNSGPVPVYPHQPGPEFQTDSEVGFTGGAALVGRSDSRGGALSSHPVTGNDLDQSGPNHNGTFLEVTKTSTEDSAGSPPQQNGNGNGNSKSKRQRLRKSLMKNISRNSKEQEPKANGFANDDHSRQNSNAMSETKVAGDEGLQGLRNSATEQGLPAPPILGQTASTGRESRFSEDL